MTHHEFCLWLEGYMDGNADMDLDMKELLREKLATVGTAAPKAQPRNDVPKTRDADDTFRGSPIISGITGGLPRGGVIGGGPVGVVPFEPFYTLTNGDPRQPMTTLSMAAASATDAMNSATLAATTNTVSASK